MAINSVTLYGRLTSDIELQHTPNDVSVCNFCIAVDRPYNKNAEQQGTNFIDCVAWRGIAETIAKYFKKGNRIIIEGILQTRNYKTQEGQNRKVTEVVVDNFGFVDRSNDVTTDNSSDDTNTSSELDVSVEDDDNDDDLPF